MGCDTGLVALVWNKRDKCSQNPIADTAGWKEGGSWGGCKWFAQQDRQDSEALCRPNTRGHGGPGGLRGRRRCQLKARKRDTLGYSPSLSNSKFDERLKAKLHTNCFHKVNGSGLNSDEFTQQLHSGMENHESPTHARIHRACQNKMWSKQKEANIWTNS